MIFKKYDIRGKYPDEINKKVAEKLGRAFAYYIYCEENILVPTIYLGRDNTEISKEVVAGFRKGFSCFGNVIYFGPCLTPQLFFNQVVNPLSGAVMVTASHIEGSYSGLKLQVGEEFLCEEKIERLKTYFEEDSGFFTYDGGEVEKREENVYFETLPQVPRGISIATNNFSWAIFFLKRGGGLISLVPPGDKLPPYSDIGLFSDRDGDRLRVVTREGELLGDRLLSVFISLYARENWDEPQLILIEDKCSPVLHEMAASLGFQSKKVPTGHSIIKNEMKKLGALLGGELSGHFYFRERGGIDDALYGACLILKELKDHGEIKPFHKLPKFATGEIRIKLKREFKEKCIVREGTFGIVKRSGTEDKVAVIRYEADNEDDFYQIKKELEEAIGCHL